MHAQKIHSIATPVYPRAAHMHARLRHPLARFAGIALLACLVLVLALMPTPAHAQDEDDVFTAAEMCEQVTAIFPALDDDERATEVRIHELEEEIEALRKVAAQFESYISADASTGDINYANTMFWVTMLRLQGVKNELILQKAHLEQIAFDRELFTEISEAFACGEEEEEAAPALPSARASCNVTSAAAIPWDRLDEVTFLVIEDPNPTQEGQRWIEFRVATTHDVGARNPSVWLDRLIAWSEAQQAEGWIELARGGQGAFCNAIAANCITPPSGMTDDSFNRLCGGEE